MYSNDKSNVKLSVTALCQTQSLAYINWLENDATTTQVLVLHHLLSMFTFLRRALFEELVEALQGNVVTIKVPCLS